MLWFPDNLRQLASLHPTHGQIALCRKRDKLFLLFPRFSQVHRALRFKPTQRALHKHKGIARLRAPVNSWDSTHACGSQCPSSSTATCSDMGTPTLSQNPTGYSPGYSPAPKGTRHTLCDKCLSSPMQVSVWLCCFSGGDAQSPPSMLQGEQGQHKGPLSAETFQCRLGRPLSYSWAILFDVMDCLHVSVSNCELHFVFLSTILSFPYSVPWPCLSVLSQNTRRCQGKFSPWWKSCQA